MVPESLPLPVAIDDDLPRPALWRFPALAMPGGLPRDVDVATPPGYETGTARYPVVYLQDGQNIFDPELSYAGHWGMLELLAEVDPKTAPIIVAIPNLGLDRLREYSPFDDLIHGEGDADSYLEFVQSVVKPLVDASFRTRPEREWTAIAGSSMGGLLAQYALVAAAGTFGSAWVMSPAFWYADGAINEWLAHQPAPVGRLWLDVGVEEGIDEVHDVRTMRSLLVSRGWRLGDTLHYLEDPEGDHDEASWRRRVRENWTTLMGLFGSPPRPSHGRRTSL